MEACATVPTALTSTRADEHTPACQQVAVSLDAATPGTTTALPPPAANGPPPTTFAARPAHLEQGGVVGEGKAAGSPLALAGGSALEKVIIAVADPEALLETPPRRTKVSRNLRGAVTTRRGSAAAAAAASAAATATAAQSAAASAGRFRDGRARFRGGAAVVAGRSRSPRRRCHRTAIATGAAAARPAVARSSSRPPRLRREEAVARLQADEVVVCSSSESRSPPPLRPQPIAKGADVRKALLTPNDVFLRDSYHQRVEVEPCDPITSTRWQFRAEKAASRTVRLRESASSAQVQFAQPVAIPEQQQALLPVRASAPATVTMPASTRTPMPSQSQAKKWRVMRANTMVRATEQIDSGEVRVLSEHEIVEQVGRLVTLSSGIVRMRIRHPSTPQFPDAIGWVTQDATAAGGPRFLEPGPEPIKPRTASWRAPGSVPTPRPWRPRGRYLAESMRPRTPPRYGTGVHANLTWTPPSS
eukprot:NODE_5898_length_1724_cov_5.920476.p1 GENE.NODE_5898_length_1724_cov_5.920476~~NODE_5898_length_1724_cov_5.920476.p1  ORF type:complete len:514 (-),score=81.03 NODE_5898_length_1724_cov_5.920476:182-1606(-)